MFKFLSNSFEETLARHKAIKKDSFEFNPVACFEKPIECNFTSMIGTVSPGNSIFQIPFKVMVLKDQSVFKHYNNTENALLFSKDGKIFSSSNFYQISDESRLDIDRFINSQPVLKKIKGFTHFSENSSGYDLLDSLYEYLKSSKETLRELKGKFSFNMDRYPRSMEFHNIANNYVGVANSDDEFTDFLVRVHFHASMLVFSEAFGSQRKDSLGAFGRANLMSLVSDEFLGPVERLEATIDTAIEILASIYRRVVEIEIAEKALLETKDSIKEYCLKTFIQDPPTQDVGRQPFQQTGTEKPKKETPDSKPAN